MAAKLKDKRTSITTVRDQFQSFATFPTPLVSHWSLPLRRKTLIFLKVIQGIFRRNDLLSSFEEGDAKGFAEIRTGDLFLDLKADALHLYQGSFKIKGKNYTEHFLKICYLLLYNF